MKIKKILLSLLTLTTIFITTSCNSGIDKIKVQLDYQINTNHTGLYVAIEKGYFEEYGLEVEVFESGNTDPLLALATNNVDYSFSYQENILMARAKDDALPVRAIAGVLHENTSGFIYKKSLNITQFKDFENKVYGSWGSDLEQKIVDSIAEVNNTNSSLITTTVLGGGSTFHNLENGFDFQWVFYGWDMIQAKHQGIENNYNFKYLQEYDNRLDFYTPVIAEKEGTDKDKTTKFMSAITKGYEYAINNYEEAATILHKYAPEYDLDFLKLSQEYISSKYKSEEQLFGYMLDSKWSTFKTWLYDYNVITSNIDHKKAYTNEYIK